MILDIINKKRLGKELSYGELYEIFNGYLDGDVADYQMSALLMAIWFKGMTDSEIFNLTEVMLNSGNKIDLSSIDGIPTTMKRIREIYQIEVGGTKDLLKNNS